MKLPKSFNDITVEQYQFANSILKHRTDTDAWIGILSYFTGKSNEYYEELELSKLQSLIASVQFLLQPKLITEINDTIIIDNEFFKGTSDITKGNFGQYASIKTILTQGDTIDNLHLLLGEIYAPIHLYNLKYDSLDVANKMKHAGVGQVLGLVFFYSRVLKSLTPIIQEYLVTVEREIKAQGESLTEYTVGM